MPEITCSARLKVRRENPVLDSVVKTYENLEQTLSIGFWRNAAPRSWRHQTSPDPAQRGTPKSAIALDDQKMKVHQIEGLHVANVANMAIVPSGKLT